MSESLIDQCILYLFLGGDGLHVHADEEGTISAHWHRMEIAG